MKKSTLKCVIIRHLFRINISDASTYVFTKLKPLNLSHAHIHLWVPVNCCKQIEYVNAIINGLPRNLQTMFALSIQPQLRLTHIDRGNRLSNTSAKDGTKLFYTIYIRENIFGPVESMYKEVHRVYRAETRALVDRFSDRSRRSKAQQQAHRSDKHLATKQTKKNRSNSFN